MLIKRFLNLNTHLFLELGVLSLRSHDFFFQLFDVFIVSHNCNFNCVIIIAIWSEKNAILARRISFGVLFFATNFIIVTSYYVTRVSRI